VVKPEEAAALVELVEVINYGKIFKQKRTSS